MPVWMPVEPPANDLLNRSPLALLIAMLLDQQVPLERAFSAPYDLARRLGHEPTSEELAGFDPEELVRIFSERPALHRYPKAMATRVQDLARLLVSQYDGDAASLWTSADSGAELLKRVAALPGFGAQKAQIFVGLLGKQLGVRPPGWQEAAGAFGAAGTFRSVADITDEVSLGEVRAYKQALKAAAKAEAGGAAGAKGSAGGGAAGAKRSAGGAKGSAGGGAAGAKRSAGGAKGSAGGGAAAAKGSAGGAKAGAGKGAAAVKGSARSAKGGAGGGEAAAKAGAGGRSGATARACTGKR